MDTPENKFLPAPWLLWGFAGAVVTVVAIFALATPSQASVDRFDGKVAPGERIDVLPPPAFEAPPQEQRYARAIIRCAECGVIELTREIETRPTAAGGNGDGGKAAHKRTATLVRFQDGSSLAISDLNPANWRQGERVILIAGTPSPGR